MNIIKSFILLGLLLSFVISCKDSPVISDPQPINKDGFPYETPENLIVELKSVVGEHICLKDNSVLVAGDSLYSINIDDINNPQIVSVLKLPNRAIGLTIYNDLAFVSIYNGHYPNNGFGGLQIVDISDINNPIFVGFYSNIQEIVSVAVIDGFAFLAMKTIYPAGEVQIINIVNAANPELIKEIKSENTPRDISISNDMAYITFWDNELKIFDISNPAEPKIVSENNSLGFNNIYTTIDSGEYLVTSYYSEGARREIYLIDVSDPENPKKQSEISSYSMTFFAYNNLIYFGSPNGIDVLNINNNNLNIISSIKMNGSVYSFSVKDTYVLGMVGIHDYDTTSFPRFQIFKSSF